MHKKNAKMIIHNVPVSCGENMLKKIILLQRLEKCFGMTKKSAHKIPH